MARPDTLPPIIPHQRNKLLFHVHKIVQPVDITAQKAELFSLGSVLRRNSSWN